MVTAVSFAEWEIVIVPIPWRQVAGIGVLLVMGVLFGVFVWLALRKR